MSVLKNEEALWMCPRCGLARQQQAGCSICHNESLLPWPEDRPLTLELRLIAADRLSDAYAALADRVSRGAQDAETCLQLAWLAYAFQDLRAVETWCHECARLDPGSAGPHVVLGHVFQRSRRYEEAVEEYEAALRLPSLLGAARRTVEDSLRQTRDCIPEF